MPFPDDQTELIYLMGKLTRLLLESNGQLNGEHRIAYMGTQGPKTIQVYVDGDMLDMDVTDGNDTGLTTYSEFYDEG